MLPKYIGEKCDKAGLSKRQRRAVADEYSSFGADAALEELKLQIMQNRRRAQQMERRFNEASKFCGL